MEPQGARRVGRDGWDRRPAPPTAGSSAVKNKSSPVPTRWASGKGELIGQDMRQRWEVMKTLR